MKAAQVIRPNEPLQLKELPNLDPGDKQVVVQVHSSGVCHSDIHIWEGGYEGAKGQLMSVEERGVKFPLTLGHEIAGTVEAVGSAVSEFKAGQRVLIYPWIGDGVCPACQVGEENHAITQSHWGYSRTVDMLKKFLSPTRNIL